MITALACLATAVYFEARSENIIGQQAVAEVVMNRVEDPRWPDTVCEVIKQRRQFSFYSDGLSDTPQDAEAYATATAVAQEALDGNTLGTGALYYHAVYVEPIWRHKLELLGKVETHVFYTDKGK